MLRVDGAAWPRPTSHVMHRQPIVSRVRAALVSLAGASLFAQAPAPAAANPPATRLEDTREALGKWIETQQVLAKERKDWQQGKEILVDRIELLKKECSLLQEKIDQATAAAEATAKKRAELVAENDRLQAETSRLAAIAARLETGVKQLVATLPETLQTAVQPLAQRIPDPSKPTRVSVAERFQNVLGVLGEATKANAEIRLETEVHTLPDGKRAEVQALYLGLGQAFYVSSGGVAAVGRPGAEGWRWQPAAIGDRVLTAIEIVQGKEKPAFVPLPVRIQ